MDKLRIPRVVAVGDYASRLGQGFAERRRMIGAGQRAEKHVEQGVITRVAAERYALRGWSVIPIPHQSKNPSFKGWEQMRLTAETIGEHFNGRPQNIGVLLGEPSGGLVDVDLDHARAIELAPDFLPPTAAIFGRPSKPRSHWLYRATSPLATKKFRSKSVGMIVEVRSTGSQTVFPPSAHESGEPICWEPGAVELAAFAPAELLGAAQRLANAILLELGENPIGVRAPRQKRPAERKEAAQEVDRAARCLEAMLRMHMVDHRDGSLRLYAAACRAVEHALTDDEGIDVIERYAALHPFPQPWSRDQIVRRLHDADRKCQRGLALQLQVNENLLRLGSHDVRTGKLVLSPQRTLPTAEAFVRHFHAHPNGRTLHCQAELLWAWTGSNYAELETEAVKAQLHLWLHEALRYAPRRGEDPKLVPFDANPTTVNAALETIRAYVHLPLAVAMPTWLDGQPHPPPDEILPCRTTMLHLSTGKRFAPTPAFFTTHVLECDPDATAAEPTQWYEFLHQLFDGDLEALELLQEWFGYCLTADTSQQKMFLLVGPRRGGKGTIARVLQALAGPLNVCGPTTSGLAGPFGLQPLIGKTLAIVSDARFSGENVGAVVERLLCISGEDAVTIDRKYLPSVTMKLPTKFMFLTNELPKLNDSSGALAGRFLILRLTESFFGREDTELTAKLLTELPGILNWAIEGWRRLRARRRFVTVQSVSDVVQDLEELSSPVGAFVRERCTVGAGRRVWVDDLYGQWRLWCERDGRAKVSTKQSFGRDLSSAVSVVRRRRGTDQVPFYDGISLKEPRFEQ